MKSENNLIVKTFEEVLELIKDVLPDRDTFTKSYYEAKYLRKNLRFNYDNIYACSNYYVLFWKEYSEFQKFWCVRHQGGGIVKIVNQICLKKCCYIFS